MLILKEMLWQKRSLYWTCGISCTQTAESGIRKVTPDIRDKVWNRLNIQRGSQVFPQRTKIWRTILTIKQTKWYSRRYIKVNNAINTSIFSILNHKANNMALSWTGKENHHLFSSYSSWNLKLKKLHYSWPAATTHPLHPSSVQEQELFNSICFKAVLRLWNENLPLNSKQYLLFAIRGPLNPGNQNFMRFSFPWGTCSKQFSAYWNTGLHKAPRAPVPVRQSPFGVT